MPKNIELEFKTVIPKSSYEEILASYNLNDNVFLQTNHYFDTPSLDLSAQDIVLRIRQKGERFFKVTIKKQHPEEAYESHILLSREQAEKMLKEGFNTKQFFPQLSYDVSHITSIDNFRASMPYKNGLMYVDRCEYCSHVDYELEYEVSDSDIGFTNFQSFLSNHGLTLKQTKRKSERAFSCQI